MKKLRLLLWKACVRECPGCCNRDWDLDSLPAIARVGELADYDEILLTGGEPMLWPTRVIDLVLSIRRVSKAKVYVYTADVSDLVTAVCVLHTADGMTLTLHEQEDVSPFLVFKQHMEKLPWVYRKKALRLNVFDGVSLPDDIDLSWWDVRLDLRWIRNCPLPDDEVFKRIPEGFIW